MGEEFLRHRCAHERSSRSSSRSLSREREHGEKSRHGKRSKRSKRIRRSRSGSPRRSEDAWKSSSPTNSHVEGGMGGGHAEPKDTDRTSEEILDAREIRDVSKGKKGEEW